MTDINPNDTTQSKEQKFVNYLFAQCNNDKNKGFAARMKRADNPATEYQCWDMLAGFNIDLEKPYQRLPYALVTAAIAKSKAEKNGQLSLGKAITMVFDDGKDSKQANARLRRLLACDDSEECCQILRPLLTLIQSHVTTPLDYAALLNELCWFNANPEKIKARWAQQFYRTEDLAFVAGSES